MKALVLNAINTSLEIKEFPNPSSTGNGVLVDLKASALNHRDLFITQGLYANIVLPCILGSDGAGLYQGNKVLINPSLSWGRRQGYQQKEFRVLGMPDPGTFATHIQIPKKQLYAIPDHLNFEEAAALPLAGLTAFRTLFSRCKLRKGEKVLITGIGGGVALLALQFALKAGAQVFVTSGSGEKIRRAKELGALDGVSYKEPSWDKQLKSLAGGFDVVIDSAGGDGFSALVGLCNAGARIGIYGGTLGKFGPISPQLIFWKQISILGSTMGSPADFDKMLQFVREHKMTPIVDKTYALDAGNQAFKYLEKSEQFGKIVLQH